MMKRFLFSLLALVVASVGMAQTQDEAFKDLIDGRVFKAQKEFEQIVAKTPADEKANYWLGQTMMIVQRLNNTNNMGAVKDLYTKAMTTTNQSPLVMVGVGHIELLEGKASEARAHFEAAIAATANKKNKKYGDPAVLIAIIRANADGGSKAGDADYAIAKAAQVEELQAATPDMYVQLGVAYLKGGGENGGPAKRSFEKALDLDPTYAPAYYRVGKIFESQRNTELFLQFYEKAINANPKFAPAYLSLYDYYKNRDVNKAKEYLDFYIANADKDKETDYFYADYLFRAGQYEASLKKGHEIESGLNGEKFPKINKLYAYNYDRLAGKFMPTGISVGMSKSSVIAVLKEPKSVNKVTTANGTTELLIYDGFAIGLDTNGNVDFVSDSKGATEPNNQNSKDYFNKAMQSMEKYMAEENPDMISGDDYSFMAASYLKVPGNVAKAEAMTEKAISADTSITGKLDYMRNIANAYAAQQNWKGQYKWLDRMYQLKPDNSARNYFFLSDAAYKAQEFDASQKYASLYIKDYPDQAQGYYLKWRSAIAADPDTSKGSAIAAVDEYNNFLMKDTAKNKRRIITNHGYKIYYYIVKAQDYQKAIESANAILALDPNDTYGQTAKSEAERLLKATTPKGTSPGTQTPGGKTSNSTGTKPGAK